MTEEEFVNRGFSEYMANLKFDGRNEAWLGPFSVASPHANYRWARWAKSAREDNAEDWLNALARLNVRKGIILSDTATRDDIARFEQAACSVEQVANAGHMIAYANADGLALAISRVLMR